MLFVGSFEHRVRGCCITQAHMRPGEEVWIHIFLFFQRGKPIQALECGTLSAGKRTGISHQGQKTRVLGEMVQPLLECVDAAIM